jgi:hypothetical protein
LSRFVTLHVTSPVINKKSSLSLFSLSLSGKP